LAQIGPNAKDAVPVLIEKLNPKYSGWVRYEAADALGAIGTEAKAAIPPLIEALNEKPSGNNIRVYAAAALWNIDQHDEALRVLISALRVNDAQRRIAFRAVAKIEPDAEDAVAFVADALKEDNLDVKIMAAETLRGWGPAARAAVPALVEAFQDKRAYLATKEALEAQLRERSAKFRDQLLQLEDKFLKGQLGQKDYQKQLAQYQAMHANTTASLERFRYERTVAFYSTVALTLAEIGPAAKGAVPVLNAALQDEDGAIRVAAAGALWLIDNQKSIAIPILIEANSGSYNRDSPRGVLYQIYSLQRKRYPPEQAGQLAAVVRFDVKDAPLEFVVKYLNGYLQANTESALELRFQPAADELKTRLLTLRLEPLSSLDFALDALSLQCGFDWEVIENVIVLKPR
jgi:HEAT repeat protein